MVDSDAFVIAGKDRRRRALVATLLIGMGLASVVLFVAGLMPAYLLEHDGGILRDAWERCPERIPSEQGYDVECVQNLMEHGPLYLGKGLLAASFVLGAAALMGAYRLHRPAVVVLSIMYLLAWVGLLGWNVERAHHFVGEGT